MKQFIFLLMFCFVMCGCRSAGKIGDDVKDGQYSCNMVTEPNPPVAGEVWLIAKVFRNMETMTEVEVSASIVKEGEESTPAPVAMEKAGDSFRCSYNFTPGNWKVTIKTTEAGRSAAMRYEFIVK